MSDEGCYASSHNHKYRLSELHDFYSDNYARFAGKINAMTLNDADSEDELEIVAI